jgi:AraC-like DNA-binding protein
MNKRVTATLPGMEVVEVQVAANVSLPASRQRLGNITMFWEGEVVVEEPERPDIRFGTGEMLYHPAHFVCGERFVTDCILVTIEVDEEKSRELFTVLADPLAPIRLPTKQLGHITAAIRRELHDSRCGRSMVLSSLVTQLIVMGSRSAEAMDGRGIPDSVQRVQQIIRAGYDTTPSPAEIAHLLGVSREHMARNFRYHVGMTISEFIRSVRIDHAKELLTDLSLCLSNVALGSGFYDQSHMSRAFKLATGMTPCQYRRSLSHEGEEAEAIGAAVDWGSRGMS